ncbi:transcriptional regulator [Streptomyces sp. NBC_01527]|uniref:transcriptional regulator n=1 Tax=unclassified Streptomyces TaxID=2593676 RepID=UPI002E154401|nr:transcriptional regulator [Streptomyces sp. NBC_01230]
MPRRPSRASEATGRRHGHRSPAPRLPRPRLPGSPEWTRSCGGFDVPVGKATLSHHSSVLRGAGPDEQHDQGPEGVDRRRREEFDARCPGRVELVLRADSPRR